MILRGMLAKTMKSRIWSTLDSYKGDIAAAWDFAMDTISELEDKLAEAEDTIKQLQDEINQGA